MNASVIKSCCIRPSIFSNNDKLNVSKTENIFLISSIVMVALGFLGASLLQYPLSIGFDAIGRGLIAKWIKNTPRKNEQVEQVVATIPETEKMVGKIVGKTTVLGKQDRIPHDVTITQNIGWHDDESTFYAYTNENGKTELIGYIQLVWFRQMENGVYGSKNYGQLNDSFNPHIYYGSVRLEEGKNLSKICINDMRSIQKDKYQGVGTALYQVAIEHGRKHGCEGRLILDAAWNSHGFHYKLGSRSPYTEQNEKIAEELEKAKAEEREPNTKELGSVWMYMPQEAIQTWKKKIEEHPILS